MTEERPDTDERDEPAGTRSPGPGNLADRPVTPGARDTGQASAVPGAYEADEDEQRRGRAVKPGN
jgi:hypothetical protein